MEEKTCLNIQPINIEDKFGELTFKPGFEYQVDIYPLFSCVYNNGGWKDYFFFSNHEFNKYFQIID